MLIPRIIDDDDEDDVPIAKRKLEIEKDNIPLAQLSKSLSTSKNSNISLSKDKNEMSFTKPNIQTQVAIKTSHSDDKDNLSSIKKIKKIEGIEKKTDIDKSLITKMNDINTKATFKPSFNDKIINSSLKTSPCSLSPIPNKKSSIEKESFTKEQERKSLISTTNKHINPPHSSKHSINEKIINKESKNQNLIKESSNSSSSLSLKERVFEASKFMVERQKEREREMERIRTEEFAKRKEALKISFDKKKPESTIPIINKEKESIKSKIIKENDEKKKIESNQKSNLIKKEKEKEKEKYSKNQPTENKKEIQELKAKVKIKDENQRKKGKDSIEEEDFSWLKSDGTIKWKTLVHSGPFFPPSYQPHGVKMIYDGQDVYLEPEAEEIAGFYAALLETDYVKNPTFTKNFFEDFRNVLKESNSKYWKIIKNLEKCNFTPMFEYFSSLKEKKKTLTKEEKEVLKGEKLEIEEKFGYALLNGKREKVGNFRIEPPGLFRGRGKHPKAGKLKHRVLSNQVTINIGHGVPIPQPPPGSKWAEVVHDNTVTWLATWVENINKQQKYVFLAPSSSFKAQSDFKKFETARNLKKCVKQIRKHNAEELKSEDLMTRQRATALWLIDHLALRAGNEKGDDEADTVGCCSLRIEHVKLIPPMTLHFDFLGKDSIRYENQVKVIPIIYKNMKDFMSRPKKKEDSIFDKLNTSGLNKYLNGLMTGLTAKVFRTYNASHTFQEELDRCDLINSTVHEKVLAYNRANRQVAVLCNHQRSVPKTHQQSMDRLKEKILSMKYQRHLIRKALKSQGEGMSSESELDDQIIKRKAMELEEMEMEKERKKQESSSQDFSPVKKRNVDGSGGGGRGSSLASSLSAASKESLFKKLTSVSDRIKASQSQLIDRDENKTTSLGTSKTNYIDPRITVAWCAKEGVPIEKMFNKSLREKFRWAMNVGKSWKF